MTRPRVIAVLAALTLCLAGCSIPTDAAPHRIQGDPLAVYATTSTTTTTPPGALTTFYIYFVKDGSLVPVKRHLSKPSPGTQSLNDALLQLAVGPSASESREQITTDFSRVESGALQVSSYDSQTGLAEIALDSSFEYLSGSSLAGALGQIVFTVTAVSDTKVTRVSFTLDGAPFSGYTPTGATIAGPVTRADYAQLYQDAPPTT